MSMFDKKQKEQEPNTTAVVPVGNTPGGAVEKFDPQNSILFDTRVDEADDLESFSLQKIVLNKESGKFNDPLDENKLVPRIDVLLLGAQKTRALFLDEKHPGKISTDKKPDCFSMDAHVPASGVFSENCKVCKYSRFETKHLLKGPDEPKPEGGGGQACKLTCIAVCLPLSYDQESAEKMKAILTSPSKEYDAEALLMLENLFLNGEPYILRIPPTGLRGFDVNVAQKSRRIQKIKRDKSNMLCRIISITAKEMKGAVHNYHIPNLEIVASFTEFLMEPKNLQYAQALAAMATRIDQYLNQQLDVSTLEDEADSQDNDMQYGAPGEAF